MRTVAADSTGLAACEGHARQRTAAWRRSLRALSTVSAAFVLSLLVPNAAACDESFSACVSLETALPMAGPSHFMLLHSFRRDVPTANRLFLRLDYQHRPLVVVAPSPDPFGREVDVLGDWLSANVGADLAVGQRLRVGLRAPLSFPLDGTGRGGIASQANDAPSASGIGDPELYASFALARGNARAGVVQRLSLPLGSAESWLSQASIRYAPSLAASVDVFDTTLGAELGLRLRESQRFGDVRFGSEGFAAAGLSQRLLPHWWATVECFVLPSLTKDEMAPTREQPIRLRRVPAEWLVQVMWKEGTRRHSLGAGGSIPLTRRRAGENEATLAGPPGPGFRMLVRIEQDL